MVRPGSAKAPYVGSIPTPASSSLESTTSVESCGRQYNQEGDLLLFDSLLLHSGNLNLAQSIRYSVQPRFTRLDVAIDEAIGRSRPPRRGEDALIREPKNQSPSDLAQFDRMEKVFQEAAGSVAAGSTGSQSSPLGRRSPSFWRATRSSKRYCTSTVPSLSVASCTGAGCSLSPSCRQSLSRPTTSARSSVSTPSKASLLFTRRTKAAVRLRTCNVAD